jgi:hypothetical protein
MDPPMSWLFAPVPLGRIAAFRALVYAFVTLDLLVFTPWVRSHANTPGDLYQPLQIGRLLHLPTPTHLLVWSVFWALLILSTAAAFGRAPRILGWAVFALYLEWMVIAMSYGKVDHDRVGLLVALAVLPTVGRARFGDKTLSDSAGWSLRLTQIVVVCAYFLSAWAKLRFGGLDWPTSAVLAQAFIRRGTWLADQVAVIPGALIVAQFGIIIFELLSPLIFAVPRRWRWIGVALFYSFHLMTFALVTISFIPQMIALASFLPLERLRPVDRLRRRFRPHEAGRAPDLAEPKPVT